MKNQMESNEEQNVPTVESVTEAPVIITVFTPAYNREKLLGRVYESLKCQTFRQFEWLIVDDGSSDGTGNLVSQWMSEDLIPIRYFWKENGGKHTALNLGIKEAAGKYLVVADSDDWLLPDGLRVLVDEWTRIDHPTDFCGVCGLFQYPDGRVVGSEFPVDPLDSNSIDLRRKYRVGGDKIALNRLEVLRKFPFPEDFPERFVPESVVWNRIAQQYDTRFVNQRIAVKEYQTAGLSIGAEFNSWHNPLVYRLRALELLEGRRTLGTMGTLRAAVAVSKCSLIARRNPLAASSISNSLLIIAALPIGFLLLVRDWLKTRPR